MKNSLLVFILIWSCSVPNQKKGNDESHDPNRPQPELKIEYASAYDIEYTEGYKIVTLNTPWQGNENALKYILRHEDTPVVPELEGIGQTIIIPIERIVCNSTSQIVLLEALGLQDKLIGFPQTQYIYSPVLNKKVERKEITEVGIEAQLNIETVLALEPDLVMAFNAGSENRQLNKLMELGMPVVMNADYMETSSLGRAEWLKFMSVFFDKEKQASTLFDEINYKYDSLKRLAVGADSISVFSGSLYGGSWFMPGGKNYGAIMMADAGGDYLWQSDDNTGWLNISFESVYDKARLADVWIGVGGFESLDGLINTDPRYGDFKAFKEKGIYSYVNRVNENGANDYFESGTLRADLVLADHIKILHPELLPDYELKYYKRLE